MKATYFFYKIVGWWFMRITEIRGIPLHWKCEQMGDALIDVKVRQALLVHIKTDCGIDGIGEAFGYGCSMRAMKIILEEQLAPFLVGEDPTNIERIWQKLFWRTVPHGRRGILMGTISGIDIALWDILGKSVGLPICKLLGAYQEKIPSYASCGFYGPQKGVDELKREIETNLRAGYRDFKIKIGRNPGMWDNPIRLMPSQAYGVKVEEDLKRIEIVRNMLHPGARLLVDTNAAWRANTILELGSELKRCGVNWLEEPTLFEDYEGCARLREQLNGILIMGFETEQGIMNYEKLIQYGTVDILQPDIGWGGGITECRKIAVLGQAHCKPISMHSFGSAVHFAASLQLAASLPNTEIIESETNINGLKTEILEKPFETDEQMSFYVPQEPGLGISINWDAIERMAIRY